MDTFRIKIKNYTVGDPSYFKEIKSSSFADNPRHKRDRTNNAYRNEMTKRGIYIPKYAISEVDFGRPEQGLELEFSAGKLLHGTNKKGVCEKDAPRTVDRLSEFLESIRVRVARREIEWATTTLVAYARNVYVDHLGSAQGIIRILAPFDYRPRSECTVTWHKGETTSELKYFNDNSHLTIYDAFAELKSDPATEEEVAIADYFKNGTNKDKYQDWVREAVRLELTLHNKVAVRQALSRFYGKKNSFTFTEAFSNEVRDTLLRNEVDHVFNHPLNKIVLLSSFDRKIFNEVINKHCKTIAQKREMRSALDTFYARGLKAYREDVLTKATLRTWFRKQKQLKQIADEIVLPRGAATEVNNAEVLEYLLSQFGIKSRVREPKQAGLF